MNLLGAKDSEQDIEKEIMDQGITPDGEGPASKKRLRATADGNGANKKSYLPMRISSAIAEDERASEVRQASPHALEINLLKLCSNFPPLRFLLRYLLMP